MDLNLLLFNRQHAYLARKAGNDFQCVPLGTHEGMSRVSWEQSSQVVQLEVLQVEEDGKWIHADR